ncbi:MATE family efflux transporter [Oleidesulfovibrio sp.]|uniref:MATE family efflux transporter n=1 Tax=Oleidesulfovibrio sp. TaxID=2909707 RepID=UPI003A8C6804
MSFLSLQKRWTMTDGYRDVLAVGLPLVVSMASSTVMQFTDRIFLSHYSVDAIAAALPASIVNLLFLLFFMGVAGYANVFIAQYCGSSAPQRVGAALWQAIHFSLMGGVILALLWFAAPLMFSLGGHAATVVELEVIYFRVLTVGAVFGLLSSAISCFYSGRGITRPVMIANVVAMIVNIPLDYAMIYGVWGFPEMGIAGAGLATVSGWALTFLLLAAVTFTRKNDYLFGVLRNWRLDGELFMRMMRFGLPSGVNYFFEIFAITFFVFVIGRLGKVELAATNIVFSIDSLAFLPMLGLNIAVSTMVGQAIGAGKPDSAATAASSTLHLAMAWMFCIGVLFIIFPGALLDWFRPSDISVAEYGPIRDSGIILMRFVAFYCLFDAISLVYFGAVKGAGDTYFVMWAMVASCLTMVVAIVVIRLWFDAGLISLWFVLTAYAVSLSLSALLRYRGGKWRNMRVVEAAPPVEEHSAIR